MTERPVKTPCVFVRPGRAIKRSRPERDPQGRAGDSIALWTLDREATSRGITVEAGVYKMSLPREIMASAVDPPAASELPARYTLVSFEPGKLAVYMLDSEP